MKKIYKEYADIKAKIEELQNKADVIKEKIQDDMKAQKVDKLPTEFGKFTLVARSYWQYTDDLKAEIAKMQKKEQATGKAKQSVTTSLTFKANV